MSKLRFAVILTAFITVCLAFLSLFTPLPENWSSSWELFHLRLIMALMIPALHVLAALFFFRGLEGFKEDLRVAYRLIATGIIMIGFTFFASPIVTFFDLWDSWLMVLGAPAAPFVVAVGVLYAGARTIFRHLAIRSIWRSSLFNAVFVLTGVVLVIFMPHEPNNLNEVVFDFGNSMFALSVMMLAVAGFNVLAIRNHVGRDYRKVLAWLGAGLLMESVLVATSIVFRALNLDPRLTGNLQDLLIFTVTPYLVSGYLFYQITADLRRVKVEQQASAVDVVLYVASLASNPQKIDPILDGLRAVTSRIGPEQPLSLQDQTALAQVYIRLEDYLVKQEPQRAFSREQLRKLVDDKFKVGKSASQNSLFWNKLSASSDKLQPVLATTGN